MATPTSQSVQKLKCDRCGGVMVWDEISTLLSLMRGGVNIGFAVMGAAVMLGVIVAPPLVIVGGDSDPRSCHHGRLVAESLEVSGV